MPRDYKLYFEDILRSIERIEEYRKGITFSKLSESNLLLDAILYNLQIIGEAAKHISDDVRKKHPDVEWRKIAGLRDIVLMNTLVCLTKSFGIYYRISYHPFMPQLRKY